MTKLAPGFTERIVAPAGIPPGADAETVVSMSVVVMAESRIRLPLFVLLESTRLNVSVTFVAVAVAALLIVKKRLAGFPEKLTETTVVPTGMPGPDTVLPGSLRTSATESPAL